ncbi:MAG: ABC transporter ATP-binding protein [Alphaproteobacteria bacterium]
MTLLTVEGLSKRFGGVVACDNVALEVRPGELHAVIGPNGAGKTTLLNQLSGELASDEGRITLDGREIVALKAPARAALGIGRSFQITSVFGEFTARENVALAVQARAGHSFRFFAKARRERALVDGAHEMLERTGLGERANTPAAALSHGEQRQLEIAMALAARPRLLLLDEPTAGMGPSESGRMVELLASLKGAVAMLLVEHDMDAVFALADRITVMTYGRVIATGSPDAIRVNDEVRAAYLGTD